MLALAVAGCGGAGSTDDAQPSPAAAEATTLAETCPEIEAKLPKSGYPSRKAWEQYQVDLEVMRSQGDTETKNALGLLIPAVNDLATDPNGMALLDAREGLRDALDLMRKRCHAVGSSALQ